MDPSTELLALINANWTTQAVRAACELDIPGHLVQGNCSLDQLAGATGCHAPSLRRLLRALATLGLCVETDAGQFGLAPMGRLLCDHDPQSLRAWALLVGGPHWARWGELHESVRTGRSFKQRHLGEEGFGDLDTDPAAAALFHRAMVQMTRRTAASVVAAIPTGKAECVVDVGGGQGELLATVLQANPSACGILFDLPAGVAGAHDAFERSGLVDRCRIQSGDFFRAVPEGGDIYLLKSVLHNWDDERAIRILANCRDAMRPGGTVIAVERTMSRRPDASTADRVTVRSDLNMLVALTGRERTHVEFDALFAQAGLGPTTLIATGGDFSLIVGGALDASRQ
ncbi:methyltransferase [Variovorax sp. J22R115]|uniref:methyltransferase n=1 Tax=Variovorax sp. J22R115 TaxID=3053509 RepID=UPI0025781FA8|nr:methyltransferase [Variovorax sp. J22R115]MDM0049732.1 methyltransferase [Variovorax sp. J22R115]